MINTKKSKWILIDNNGIIINIYSSNVEQFNMIKASWNSDIKIGENIKWYDKNYFRIQNKILIEMGIRIDNRGWYRKTDNHAISFQILNLDVLVPDGYEKIP